MPSNHQPSRRHPRSSVLAALSPLVLTGWALGLAPLPALAQGPGPGAEKPEPQVLLVPALGDDSPARTLPPEEKTRVVPPREERRAPPPPPPAASSGGGVTIPALGEQAVVAPRRDHRLRDRDSEILLDYREVLLELSRGDKSVAHEQLYELERWVLESRHPKDAQLLFDQEVKVIAWLAKREPEALVPLLWLHHDSYPAYLDRGEPYLAGHARKIAASLAVLYAKTGGTEGSRVLAARALASLGIYAQQAGVLRESLGLLVEALELDPTNEAALLGMAIANERSGGHERAAERLRRLVEVYPEHREGRLRLAINLARLGERDRAESHLEWLIDHGGPVDWIQSLAHQELARLVAERGEWRAAQGLLFQALDRELPGVGRIRTQLAYVLDVNRAPHRALQVIEALPASEEDEEPSPRFLYGRGPQEAYASLRASLAETATNRLPRLASVLEASFDLEGAAA